MSRLKTYAPTKPMPDAAAAQAPAREPVVRPAAPRSPALPPRLMPLGSLASPTQRAAALHAAQRRYGNRAVQRLLSAPDIQTKLTVSEPGDRYEQEAERTADAVMAHAPLLLRQARCSGGGVACPDAACSECRARQLVQKPESTHARPTIAPPIVHRVLSSRGGQPLEPTLRHEFEDRLGYDLGAVRLYTGGEAAESARAVNARAYSVGQDIVFGAGAYAPGTESGQRLLAHELTHTIQPSGRGTAERSGELEIGPADDASEREAEVVANAISPLSRPTAKAHWPSSAPGRSIVRRAWYDVFVESAEWVGGKVASGAEAAWESAAWLAGKARAEARRVTGAVWACAKATGRSAWNILTLNVSSLSDLLGVPRPKSEGAPGLLDTIISLVQHPCLQMIPGYTLLAGAVRQVHSLRNVLTGAWQVMQNPGVVLDALRAALGDLMGQIPGRARALTRAAITFSEPRQEHLEGIWRHLEPKLDYLANNWWEVIKQTGWDLLWPWPGVWKDLGEIWDHTDAAAIALWDLNFSEAIDHLNAIWRKANEALGRLYGWFFLAAVLIGTIAGAIAGGGVGALPGAAAGAKLALSVGQALLISTIAAETVSIMKAGYDLTFTEQSAEAQEGDYEQIANSGLTLAITGTMFLLGALAARFARAVISRVAALVWRRPALRGRGTTARGDVIEVRVATAARVIGILKRRAVTWLEAIRRNFPVIDLLENGQVTITPRPGRAPLYQVTGGRLISVKSTQLIGADAQGAIQGWIDDLAGFTTVKNVTVSNPSGRTLMVAVQTPLDQATIAALNTYAAGRGVAIEIFTHLPPNHPAVIFPDAVPAVMAEAGVVADAETTER